MRQAFFTVKGIPGVYPGYTDNHTAHFNFAIATAILHAQEKRGYRWSSDPSTDVFYVWRATTTQAIDGQRWVVEGRPVTLYVLPWSSRELTPLPAAEAILRACEHDVTKVRAFYAQAASLQGKNALVDAILDAIDAWLIPHTFDLHPVTIDDVLQAFSSTLEDD
jgi:hypothetical protein